MKSERNGPPEAPEDKTPGEDLRDLNAEVPEVFRRFLGHIVPVATEKNRGSLTLVKVQTNIYGTTRIYVAPRNARLAAMRCAYAVPLRPGETIVATATVDGRKRIFKVESKISHNF